jgi:hypothetical protein
MVVFYLGIGVVVECGNDAGIAGLATRRGFYAIMTPHRNANSFSAMSISILRAVTMQ